MKKAGLLIGLLLTAVAVFGQIDTTVNIDVSQNINRQAIEKQFGEYVKEYRIRHNLSYDIITKEFSTIASAELSYDVSYDREYLKKMEEHEYLPPLNVQKAIIEHIVESY